jgi:3-phosphoshikimate 1-carboxyvinyltransferase
MDISIQKSELHNFKTVKITGSKSESNRLLLLQALYPNISIENLSNSDDSVLMQQALASSESVIDIHHAGTAMRFLTAYLAIQEGKEVEITGSSRMKERPIKILVEALKTLGADISYLENEGYPPLKIVGKKLTNTEVELEANVSSQYISALLLIASKLENGLKLSLNGTITSVPYIKMTIGLLNEIGVKTSFVENEITIKPLKTEGLPQTLTVESDWSSASYFYSSIALSTIGTEITIGSYKEDSLQGDSVLAQLYKHFGVSTFYDDNKIRLVKTEAVKTSSLEFQLSDAPDIAQTIAVTAFGLGLECYMTGLHTLKIKETDRLVALKIELEKLGAVVEITAASLHIKSSDAIRSNISIDTYNDHRMAMAFAPLGLKTALSINNADVVSKSYPQFWDDFKAIGFQLK